MLKESPTANEFASVMAASAEVEALEKNCVFSSNSAGPASSPLSDSFAPIGHGNGGVHSSDSATSEAICSLKAQLSAAETSLHTAETSLQATLPLLLHNSATSHNMTTSSLHPALPWTWNHALGQEYRARRTAACPAGGDQGLDWTGLGRDGKLSHSDSVRNIVVVGCTQGRERASSESFLCEFQIGDQI